MATRMRRSRMAVRRCTGQGADLSVHDIGSRDTVHGLAGVSWQAIDYADGLVRVGVQSSISHPETGALLPGAPTSGGCPCRRFP